MDWPLTGALAGVTLLAGVVTFGTIAVLRSTPEPVKKAPSFVPVVLSSESVADLSGPELPSAAPPSLYPPDPPPTVARKAPAAQAPAPAPAAATAPEPRSKAPPPAEQKKVASVAPAAQAPPPPSPPVIQWRVVTTSKAHGMNLGGHVDKNGVVGSLASGHLREALRKHRNYGKLPAPIRTHIETENINLVRIAPYRALVGIDDKKLVDEQGVRFVRVASSR